MLRKYVPLANDDTLNELFPSVTFLLSINLPSAALNDAVDFSANPVINTMKRPFVTGLGNTTAFEHISLLQLIYHIFR